MGVNFAGWTRLTVDGSEGTEITRKMGEKLDDDGTVITDTFLIQPHAQEGVYVLNGEETETWETSLPFKGFRYLEVEGFPGTPTPENVEGVVVPQTVLGTATVESRGYEYTISLTGDQNDPSNYLVGSIVVAGINGGIVSTDGVEFQHANPHSNDANGFSAFYTN